MIWANNTRLFLIFFIALMGQMFAGNVSCQTPYSITLNDESGLPSNEVYQIVQDKKGYLWIGCDAGLYRYDGIRFVAYKNPKQNGRSISNLVFDAQGVLWCRNFNGQIYKVSNDSLKLVVDDSKSANKFQICFGDEAGYWRIDNVNLTQHNEEGKIIYKFPLQLKGDFNGNGTDMLIHDRKIWIEIAAMGLFVFDLQHKTFGSVFPIAAGVSYQNQRLFVNQGRLCLMRSEAVPSIHNYLYLINPKDNSYKQFYYFMNPNQIRNYHFSEDSKNRLWIASSFGAVCIPEIHLFTMPERICFKGQKISSVLHDQEGSFWFTDLQNGLHFIPELSVLTYDEEINTKERGEITLLKVWDSTTMVVGHYDGSVGFFNPLTKTCVYPDAINKHKGIAVKDVFFRDNLLYIARGHLLVYDRVKDKSVIPELFGNARGLLIHKRQLISIHPEYVSAIDISDIANGKALLPIKIVNRGGRTLIKETKNDHVYLALNDGLHLWYNEKLSPLFHEDLPIYAAAMASNKDAVYVGTQNQGVLELKKGKVTRKFIEIAELEDISVRALHASDEYLWLCTNSDFLRLDLKTGNRHVYSRNLGINPKDVNSIAALGDQLFIGSKKHLLSIPMNLEPTNTIAPTIHLEKKSTDQGALGGRKQQLPYDFSNLRFEFKAFSYRSRKDLNYAYRLLGFDSTWNYLSYDNPVAIFSSLPPGDYIFEVRAINESGLFGNTEKFSFTVLSPIWQKAWFYLLLIVLTVLVMFYLFKRRLKTIRKRNEIEKMMINSQLSALKAQMNPHFMYNALNSIQALILNRDIENSNMYLSKFSNLMRKVLDASGKETINLNEEIEILQLYLDLEKLRFGDDLNFSIHIDPEMDAYAIHLPAMLLQPYVENALKHGLLHKKGQKQLRISFAEENQHLRCEITDNGVGRAKSEEIQRRRSKAHHSFATSANEKRLELLNTYGNMRYQVEIIDLYEGTEARGTTVRIEIPIHDDLES